MMTFEIASNSSSSSSSTDYFTYCKEPGDADAPTKCGDRGSIFSFTTVFASLQQMSVTGGADFSTPSIFQYYFTRRKLFLFLVLLFFISFEGAILDELLNKHLSLRCLS